MEIFKNLDGREKCLGLHLWESWNLSAFVVAMQSLSRVWLLATPWTAAYQASLCFSVSWSLLKFMSIESVILSNCLILCGPFSSCPQSLPASGSFPMNQLFKWGGQSIELSALASILPINIQDWFPLGLTGLISLQSKGLSRVFPSTTKSINSSVLSLLYGSTLTSIHDYWKNHSFDYMDFCWQSDFSAF